MKSKSHTQSEARNDFTTVSSQPVQPLYTQEDLAPLDADRDSGMPGQYPYTRGIHADMYRGKVWTMRQFAGFGTAKDTNERFHYLLKQGQTGLSVAFHFPTLMGYDSDSPFSRGEVGKCGVAIDTLQDMEVLFDAIPLHQVTTSMTINPPAAVLLCMYIAVAEKQGVDGRKISGTIQNDILKEYIAQNSFIFPPEPSVRLVVDSIAYCTEQLPRWNTVSISGYHIREAGSTAVQELAFTLANGLTYVQACVDRGLDVDAFAPRLSFFFNAHIDFFEEVAKYRAARRIWARFMREHFRARDPRSLKLRFHTQTAGCSLTAQQPYNNVVRTAIQAMAAVCGGTQSLHTNAFDETLALPSEDSVRLALRTQQIIAQESGLINTVDPLGGSYFVETLTRRMEEEALAIIDKIATMGGMIAAIKAGYPQREIHLAALAYQRKLERGDKVIVGVNRYTLADESPIPILKVADEVEAIQIENLKKVKATRNQQAVTLCLKDLQDAAATTKNLMPYILGAVKTYASVGEICDTLRSVWGEYHDPGIF